MHLARPRFNEWLGRRHALRVLGPIALAVALSGCGSPPGSGGLANLTAAATQNPVSQTPPPATPAPSIAPSIASASPASVPADWKRTEVAADGYSIATPKDWSSVAIAGKDIDAMIAQFKTDNPELATILQQARDAGQSFSLMALDTDPATIGATGFAPNVNVVVSDSQGYGDDLVAAATIAQLRQLTIFEGQVDDQKVALPADAGAHRLRYHLKVSATLSTVATLYILTSGTKTYAVTMSAVETQLPGLESTFASIAESLVFLAP